MPVAQPRSVPNVGSFAGATKAGLIAAGLMAVVAASGCQNSLANETGALFGTICHNDGSRAREVLVQASTETFAADGRSDSAGAWSLDGLPVGRVNFAVSINGAARTWSVEVIRSENTEVLDPYCGPTGPIDPEASPEATPEGTPEATPEGTPEGTPEPGASPEPEPVIGFGAVSGCICDNKNGTWLGAADVTVTRGDDVETTQTDEDGCFVFNDIAAGAWTLRIVRGEFDVSTDVDIDPDQLTRINTPEECGEPAVCEVDARITPDEATSTPVDVIYVIDSSGSMDDEIAVVQANLNQFSQDISASGIDHRVIVIGELAAISIPAPLGTSAEFLQVDVEVGSNDALELLIAQFPTYRSFLRPGSKKHIVIISDDDSDMSSNNFLDAIAAIPNAPFGEAGVDWLMHSVVGFGPVWFVGCNGAASEGDEYLELTEATSGVLASICDDDFSPVFDAIVTAVEISAALPCAFQLPPAPEGYSHDIDNVTVQYEPLVDAAVPMSEVSGPDACTEWGWYIEEDPFVGTSVVSCPTACTALRADGDGSVVVQVGCSEVAP